MFLDCPAYLEDKGARRYGLPAEMRRRFTTQSSDGPLEAAMIRCPSGHWFNGPIESLTWEHTQELEADSPAAAARSAPSRVTPALTAGPGLPAGWSGCASASSWIAGDPGLAVAPVGPVTRSG